MAVLLTWGAIAYSPSTRACASVSEAWTYQHAWNGALAQLAVWDRQVVATVEGTQYAVLVVSTTGSWRVGYSAGLFGSYAKAESEARRLFDYREGGTLQAVCWAYGGASGGAG